MTPLLQRSLELLEAMKPRSDAQRRAIFAKMGSGGLRKSNVSSSFRGVKLYHGDKSDDRKKVLSGLKATGGFGSMRIQAYSTSALKKVLAARKKATKAKEAEKSAPRTKRFLDKNQITAIGTGRINPKWNF